MTEDVRVVILGAGGGSRDVLDIFDAQRQAGGHHTVLGFIVDPEFAKPGHFVNDRPVLGGFEWLAAHIEEVHVICGVGDPALRAKLIQRATALGARFCSVVHPSVIRTPYVTTGQGVSIGAGTIITNQVTIGDHVQINVACSLSHDVHIGSFVTLSPGVRLAGNVRVETGCFIGMGANVIERKTLGAWSIIGAGSTIISDVPPNTTVVGVPGKVIKTRPEGWHEN